MKIGSSALGIESTNNRIGSLHFQQYIGSDLFSIGSIPTLQGLDPLLNGLVPHLMDRIQLSIYLHACEKQVQGVNCLLSYNPLKYAHNRPDCKSIRSRKYSTHSRIKPNECVSYLLFHLIIFFEIVNYLKQTQH